MVFFAKNNQKFYKYGIFFHLYEIRRKRLKDIKHTKEKCRA